MLDHLGDAAGAAPALLGCRLVRTGDGPRRVGVIVETEAYPPDDPACHAYGGRTARNAAMFGPAGSAYVYRIHRSTCLNVVTGPAGSGQAVLIRAIEPLEGLDVMRAARELATVGNAIPDGTALTNGPGKLCQALDVGLEHDGVPLIRRRAPRSASASPSAGVLYLMPALDRPDVACSPRIGISRARDAPLRFFVPGNPYVSGRPRRAS